MEKDDIGYLGEMYVLYKLSTLKIKAINLPDFFDYDILTSKEIRIEVKTSSIVLDKDKRRENYRREIWQFLNYKRKVNRLGEGKFEYKDSSRNRNCDFFIFVCLNEEKAVETSYIVPKEAVGTKISITIPRNPKSRKFQFPDYKENWKQLII